MSEVKDDNKGAPQANGAGAVANGIAQDIFRQASALGGFLVVSFIAPIGGGGNGSTVREQALSAAGASAREKMKDIAARMPSSQAKPGPQQEKPVQEEPVLESLSVVPKA